MKENGYTNIDALDACEEMLKKSKQHNAYTNHITAYLGKNRLPIEDGELLTTRSAKADGQSRVSSEFRSILICLQY